MRTYAITGGRSISLLAAFCAVISFGNRVSSDDAVDRRLSIANVRLLYFSDEHRLHASFVLLNASDSNITVLSKGFGVGLSRFIPIPKPNEKEEAKGRSESTVASHQVKDREHPCVFECQAAIFMKYQGHDILQSLYTFAPVTLKPGEGVSILLNHKIMHDSDSDVDLFNIDKDTDVIIRYTVSEKFGKRFNTWYGSISTDPIKPQVIGR